jgi:hypothetical protein
MDAAQPTRHTPRRSLSGGLVRRSAVVLLLALLAGACGLNERGPWLDMNGNQMRGNDMIEFDGFAICEQTQVVFIQFFGDQYAKDPTGALGQLESRETGEALSFELLDTLPEGLTGTDITHAGREIYVGEDRPDYLYVRLPSGETERWPRAEETCEREEPL